ncbi:hypothetical protein G4Y79_00125 [Phototrophicus methaneseepsis]|uniref:Uncharacterized protein n=1 Tax=Phototrophicus methaneseepsis TaxID=2710758 RepID=A0A7S8E9H9_9CHLR|nr:hypothetical protein [Phototrophicus methaneseepsis]QPC82817.1 hypothetical protein G4Y79_00125 [Phototrophicus methaneseepsis]
MNESALEVVNNALGLDMNNMGLQVMLVFSVGLLLFFIIAPLAGAAFWGVTSSWKNTLLSMSVGAFVASASNVGLTFLLESIVPEGRLTEFQMGLIAAIGAFALGWAAQRLAAFVVAPLGKGYYAMQEESLDEDELLPFERKRRQHMTRRKRILGD